MKVLIVAGPHAGETIPYQGRRFQLPIPIVEMAPWTRNPTIEPLVMDVASYLVSVVSTSAGGSWLVALPEDESRDPCFVAMAFMFNQCMNDAVLPASHSRRRGSGCCGRVRGEPHGIGCPERDSAGEEHQRYYTQRIQERREREAAGITSNAKCNWDFRGEHPVLQVPQRSGCLECHGTGQVLLLNDTVPCSLGCRP